MTLHFWGDLSLHAEEHGGGGGHDAAEKKTSESHEGSKGEGGENSGNFIKKDEYLELNSSIEQLNAKIKSKNDTLKKLLIDKDHVKDPVEFKNMTKQVETEYRELKELSESVDKKRAILRYRFPERSFVKNAEKSKVQHLEEIGTEAIVEKKLNQLIETVEGQYGQPVKDAEVPQKLRAPASHGDGGGTEATAPQIQNPEDFSKSLILKK